MWSLLCLPTLSIKAADCYYLTYPKILPYVGTRKNLWYEHSVDRSGCKACMMWQRGLSKW